MAQFKEVPQGIYTVRFDKCEERVTKTGKPKLFAQFRIVQGEFAGQCLFMHQLRTNEVGNKVAEMFKNKALACGVGEFGTPFALTYKVKEVNGSKYDQFFID